MAKLKINLLHYSLPVLRSNERELYKMELSFKLKKSKTKANDPFPSLSNYLVTVLLCVFDFLIVFTYIVEVEGGKRTCRVDRDMLPNLPSAACLCVAWVKYFYLSSVFPVFHKWIIPKAREQ